MKIKKAGKRLDKVEGLLSDVMERYAVTQPQLRELLASARNSVMLAKAALQQAVVEEGGQEEPLLERETEAPKPQMPTSGRKRARKSAPAPKLVS